MEWSTYEIWSLSLSLLSLPPSLFPSALSSIYYMQIPYEQGQTYASEVNAIFAETSALTAKNVEEMFIEISE